MRGFPPPRPSSLLDREITKLCFALGMNFFPVCDENLTSIGPNLVHHLYF